MMRQYLLVLAVLALVPLTVSAQAGPSCEEQLAEKHTTLLFVRSSRQQIEENAGFTVATLQKNIESLRSELEHLKKAAPQPVPATENLTKKELSP